MDRNVFETKTDAELRECYKNFCEEDYGCAGHETPLGEIYRIYRVIGMKHPEESVSYELLREISKRWYQM